MTSVTAHPLYARDRPTFLFAMTVIASPRKARHPDHVGRTPRSLVVVCFIACPCILAASYMLLKDMDQSRRGNSVVKTVGEDGIIASDAELPSDLRVPDYSDSEFCRDKGPLLDIIRSTGVDIDHHEQRDIICSYLPKWSDIVSLYGNEPKIIGLDTCQQYRDMLAEANKTSATPIYPMARVAGLQNCGTTAMADTFFDNFIANPTIKSTNPRAYNVPWRKHTPWHLRFNITSPNYGWSEKKEHVLPVVVVRDPYRWMASMVCLLRL